MITLISILESREHIEHIELCGGQSYVAAWYKQHKQLENVHTHCIVEFVGLVGNYKLRQTIGN